MAEALLSKKISAVSDLIRLKKQYGTALLLSPALWSLFLASSGIPPLKLLLIFTLAAFLMRSAGCAINDFADRGFDAFVERTKGRPIVDGRLDKKEALAVFAVLSLLAFSLVLFLNAFTIALSLVAILLAIIYPFVKRVSFFPQVFLGAAFGWGAIMAWSAVRGTIGVPAVLIFIANVFWSTAYDTIYALMDIEDDLKVGVKSTAIFFKSRVYEAVCLFYVATGAALILAGVFAGLGAIYYSGVVVFCLFFIVMVVRLKKCPVREEADKVFRSNVWGGAFILVSIIIDMNI